MIINTDIIIDNAIINSDFLKRLCVCTGRPLLKFPKYKLSNPKFVRAVNEGKCFVIPYVLVNPEQPYEVNKLLIEIEWCDQTFKGDFSIKYVSKQDVQAIDGHGDRLVIAFENDEDQILFLLRSDIGKC
ncbi:MAG: hypothetical protein V3W20_11745 [Candidatus Neomarinimicrobiota bacterium]